MTFSSSVSDGVEAGVGPVPVVGEDAGEAVDVEVDVGEGVRMEDSKEP
jgi:hypothetical protein